MPTTEGETIRPLSHWRMSLVGFEPNAIRLSCQMLDQWPRSFNAEIKASGKIRVLYISLCNIRWIITSGGWENKERGFRYLPFRTWFSEYLRRDVTWSVSVWNKQRTTQVVGGKFPWLQENHETGYFNGDYVKNARDLKWLPIVISTGDWWINIAWLRMRV